MIKFNKFSLFGLLAVSIFSLSIFAQDVDTDNEVEVDDDQIEEVIAFWYEGGNYHDDDYISMALRNVISNWENENEEYLI